MLRSYLELIKLDTFEERFDYLKLDGQVGVQTLDLIAGSIKFCIDRLNGSS